MVLPPSSFKRPRENIKLSLMLIRKTFFDAGRSFLACSGVCILRRLRPLESEVECSDNYRAGLGGGSFSSRFSLSKKRREINIEAPSTPLIEPWKALSFVKNGI